MANGQKVVLAEVSMLFDPKPFDFQDTRTGQHREGVSYQIELRIEGVGTGRLSITKEQHAELATKVQRGSVVQLVPRPYLYNGKLQCGVNVLPVNDQAAD